MISMNNDQFGHSVTGFDCVGSCGEIQNAGDCGVCVTYSNKINPDHHRLHTTFSETNGGVCNPTKGQPFTTLKS